jgi:hypothetical protein
MLFQKRGPVELLDQMYTLAYLLTGSLKKTNDLVYKTYERVSSHTSDIGLFKTFREVYHEAAALDEHQNQRGKANGSAVTLLQEQTDILLAALLVEICALQHFEISIIMNRSIDTIRLWLSLGRKALLKSSMSSSMRPPVRTGPVALQEH